MKKRHAVRICPVGAIKAIQIVTSEGDDTPIRCCLCDGPTEAYNVLQEAMSIGDTVVLEDRRGKRKEIIVTKKVKDDDLAIPEFLKISAEERRKAWEDFPPRVHRAGFKPEEKKVSEEKKTLEQLTEDYNKVVTTIRTLGGNARERKFENEAEAEEAIKRIKSSLRAMQQGHAEEKKAEPAVTEEKSSDGPKAKAKEKTTVAKGNGTKKPAKKAAAKKAVKSATPTRGRQSAFQPEMKITVLAKENPRREGSAKFKQFELLKKGTVGAYVKAGGELGTLRHSVKKGWARVGK